MNTIRSNDINPSFARSNNKLAKVITAMTKNDAMAPVVALEATVVTGRTYQAYKRGKGDEARERFIEETMGSITWLCGVKVMNDIGDKLVSKILKSNGKNFDVGSDKVLRTPFENFMKKVAPKGFSGKQVALIKFVKVLTSIIITNAFIGFVVPKLNQSLTRQISHARKEEREHNKTNNPAFKGNAMGAINTFTNVIENTNTGKLLSSDAGIAGGRMYNARTEEERREIAIRDIGSIYFYMWASGHVGNILNMIESGRPTRLNPTTAGILNDYLDKVIDENGGSMTTEEFRKAVLGNKNTKIPVSLVFEKEELSSFDKLFGSKPLEVIKLKDAQKAFKDKDIKKRLKAMSELQPKRQGESILTKQQVIDAVNKAEINNPELLKNAFSEFTGGKPVEGNKNSKITQYSGGDYNDEYKFVSNKKLYKLKSEMEQYVDDICKSAKGRKIDKKFIASAEKKNLTYNGINFAAGFAVSAAFLSTFIPKIQYWVTRKTTGVDAFPGTYDYKNHKEIDE